MLKSFTLAFSVLCKLLHKLRTSELLLLSPIFVFETSAISPLGFLLFFLVWYYLSVVKHKHYKLLQIHLKSTVESVNIEVTCASAILLGQLLELWPDCLHNPQVIFLPTLYIRLVFLLHPCLFFCFSCLYQAFS